MGKRNQDIDKVLEYMHRNCKREYSLAEIAERCGCSKQNIDNIYASAMKKLQRPNRRVLAELKAFLKNE